MQEMQTIWRSLASVMTSALLSLSAIGAQGDALSDPILDPQGLINVWRLRADVAKVEPLFATGDTDVCYPEGDPDAPVPTRQERLRQERQDKECVANVKRRLEIYQQAAAALNREWRPALLKAISKGDLVAEVIMRQCTTTPVLDRTQIESTCDEDEARRITAARRLRAIGFAPAFDSADMPQRAGRISLAEAQRLALEALRQGMLGMNTFAALHDGTSPYTPTELHEIRVTKVIDAVRQEMPRAFTVSVRGWRDKHWHTDEFSSLRLSRQPLTPGDLSWGRNLYKGDHLSDLQNWRFIWRMSEGLDVYLYYDGKRQIKVGGAKDTEFQALLNEILATAEANIERHLQQDSRWGVFLLQRVGHHEWVPVGMQSTTGRLHPSWRGEWGPVRTFVDWEPVEAATPPVHYFIQGDESGTTLSAPSINARCELRYSGGVTSDRRLSELPLTQWGSKPRFDFEPLDPRKRYRQVLVWCPQGEWFDNNRVHFLLLADDTLIEVSRESAQKSPVMVRHYRRAGAADGGKPAER